MSIIGLGDGRPYLAHGLSQVDSDSVNNNNHFMNVVSTGKI